jgi:hypothetical protein
MSLRSRTSQAIQKAGQALFEANTAITKSVIEQKDYVLNMGADVLISGDGVNAFKDLQALAVLSREMQAIEDGLKAIYAKSLELSSPANSVLLGHAKTAATHADANATDVVARDVAPKRGRKPKVVIADAPTPKVRKSPPVKFRGPNGEAWSGRGSTPLWVRKLEAEGQSRSEFLVTP